MTVMFGLSRCSMLALSAALSGACASSVGPGTGTNPDALEDAQGAPQLDAGAERAREPDGVNDAFVEDAAPASAEMNDASLDGDGGSAAVADSSRVAPASSDAGARCAPAMCDYQTALGCSGDTPSCVPTSFVGPSYTTIAAACARAGSARAGEACTENVDCVVAHVCRAGRCRRLCCKGDSSVCAPTERCFGKGGDDAELCLPVNTCNPLEPASCFREEAQEACEIIDSAGDTACVVEGHGVGSDTCGEASPCARGFTCTSHWCRRFCAVGATTAAPGAPICQSWDGQCVHSPRDPAGVGECMPVSSPTPP